MSRLFVKGYFWKKIFSGLMAFIFAVGSVGTSYAQTVPMSAPGTMVSLSASFAPPLLKGVKVYPDNPFRLDFILDKGNFDDSTELLKLESTRLIKYFLASITVPEKDLWVNLSPYEKDRVIPDAFGVTEMGRDLLAQDYMLKQITASVIYPEGEVGKAFWAKVYTEAQKRYGMTDVPVDTFNKVWIVPEKAVVYESKDSAYVVESRLKVMLEEDYLSLEKNMIIKDQNAPATNKLGSDIVREVVIPILEKEVNEGKNFTQLRQVYHSLILAVWFKDKVKESIFGKAYVDQKKTGGVDIEDKAEKEKIWAQYVEAFKKGAYNYIKEDFDSTTQQTVPRKYFSGGNAFFQISDVEEVYDQTTYSGRLPEDVSDRAMIVTANLNSVDSAQEDNNSKPFNEGAGLEHFIEVLDSYGLGEVVNTKILRHADTAGGIKVLYVRTNRGEYVLKQYPFVLSKQSLLDADAFNEDLRQQGLPYRLLNRIQAKNGQDDVVFENNTYVLYAWGGKNLKQMDFSVDKNLEITARVLADYHTASSLIQKAPPQQISGNYRVSFSRPKELIDERSRLIQAVVLSNKIIPTSARELFLSDGYQVILGQHIKKFVENFSADRDKTLEEIPVHGDFYSRNILVDESGVPVALIDFDDVLMESRLFDIAHNFVSFLIDLRKQRNVSPEDVRDLMGHFLRTYILGLNNVQGLSDQEIDALKGYIRGKLLYEIFLRANLLTNVDQGSYFNTSPGDSRFFGELKGISDILETLDQVDFVPLSGSLQDASRAKNVVREVLAQNMHSGKDVLLLSIDDVVAQVPQQATLSPGLIKEAFYAQIGIKVRQSLAQMRELERASEETFASDPQGAAGKLRKAVDLMERVSAASGFEPFYVKEYARLSYKLEEKIFSREELIPKDRHDQIVLIPTHNRATSLIDLLKSLENELKTFSFGKYDEDHKLIFVVIEDSSDPQVLAENRRTIERYRSALAALSPNYDLQYWDGTRQGKLIEEINVNTYKGQWDVRNVVFSKVNETGVKTKGFAGVRNLGLMIARDQAKAFNNPDQTIVTWIDDDSRWGTTVAHQDGTKESGVRAINYFQKTQEAFSGNVGILLGGTTNDSVNGVAQLSTVEDLLDIFKQAKQDARPDSLLQSLNSFSEISRGRFPLRTISYWPQDRDASDDGHIRAVFTRRSGAGNNASFLVGALAAASPYMPVSRGEDLLKNILDAGTLPPAFEVANTKFNPIDHHRLSGRVDIRQELYSQFSGINRVQAFAALVKNLLLSNGVRKSLSNNDIFLNLEHIHQITLRMLDQLESPERYLGFAEWQTAVKGNYGYINASIVKAQIVAQAIRQNGYLTDSQFFWVTDPRFAPVLKIIDDDFVKVFEKESPVPQMEEEYARATTNPELYQVFLEDIREYGRNLKQWRKLGNEDHSQGSAMSTGIYETSRGRRYSALINIRAENESGQEALAYSYMKFGEPAVIASFSGQLTEQIRKDLGSGINSNKEEWLVLSPAGYGVPNAAFLMARQVAANLGLSHMTMFRPSQGLRESLCRMTQWGLAENGSIVSDYETKLAHRKVIFIDDGVLNGTVMDSYIPHLYESGVESVSPYVVAKLEGIGPFEKVIDLQILTRLGINSLVKILNNKQSVCTTRMVKYSLELRPHQFDEFLSDLTLEARINLYLYAVEYFDGHPLPNLDKLANSILKETAISLPKIEQLSRINSREFFENVIELVRNRDFRVSAQDIQVIASEISGFMKRAVKDEIKLVVFDLDKTLNHSTAYYEAVREASVESISARLSIKKKEVLWRISLLRDRLKADGFPLRQHNIAIEFGITPEELDKEIARRVDIGNFIVAGGLPDEFSKLKSAGIRVAVLTESPREQTQGVLRALGIDQLTDDIIIAGELGYHKPEEALFREVLNRFGVQPGEAVMVGDSERLDIAPARSLGMRTIFVDSSADILKIVERVYASTTENTGGIDLTRDKMKIQVRGAESDGQFKFDQAMIQQLQNASGLTPVIIDIQPMTTTVPMFLGLKDNAPTAGQLSMR